MAGAVTATFIALISYLGVILFIGYITARSVKSEEDYFIGGYKLPGFALALSERSTDMSGWLLCTGNDPHLYLGSIFQSRRVCIIYCGARIHHPVGRAWI